VTLESGIRVGKYVVGPKLGQGGFGILHAARDTDLDREIAIKFLRPEHAFRPSVVQRFLQEARAAARINHPGIVTVYESGIVGGTDTRADGTVYIAMELLSGETLAQRLKTYGRLPVPVAIGIVRQLAAALSAAHASAIVHRDLKPQNVFLVPDPAVVGGERVKVLDFGIAKLVDDFGSNIQTHSMLMLGTPMYMSPEQCKSSAKVDARSDIYALGCIFFELVCGRAPFDGDSGELIAKHQLIPPPTARSIVSSLPMALDHLLMRMLAKLPDDRPQTMDAVLDALHAFGDAGNAPAIPEDTVPFRPGPADTESSTTLSESAASRAVPAARTRRTLVLLGAAAAIAVGIGVGALAVRGSHDDVAASVPESPAPAVRDATTPVIAEVVPLDAAAAPVPVPSESRDEAVRNADLVAPKKKIDTKPVPTKRPPESVAETPKAPTTCDAETLDEAARQDESIGQHASALGKMERAIACKPSERRYQLAFMSACNAGNKGKAKLYYKSAGPSRSSLAQMCYRNGITAEDLNSP
jgi:serine/threonine-protein kinase